MVGVLIPWLVTVDQYQEKQWFAPRNELFAKGCRLDPELRKKLEGSQKLLKADFCLGLRVHRVTAPFFAFLARAPRAYCVWHAPADGTRDAPGFETRLLLAILDAMNAKNVGYKADVRIIFVHVGALKTFYRLEALAMRRCKQPDLRIYSYGTHESVKPTRWGLREIYPLGTLHWSDSV